MPVTTGENTFHNGRFHLTGTGTLLRTMTARFPDFLIIGAMKCATTSIADDLRCMRGIFLPAHKEPHDLVDDAVLSPKGQKRYRRLFGPAKPTDLCGEASTRYTQMPRYTGAHERAWRLCGPNLKIIYIVREPFARMQSHLRHVSLKRKAERHDRPEYFTAQDMEREAIGETSNYLTQLTPWRETFGDDNILVTTFESYVLQPLPEIEKIAAFLGLEKCAAWTGAARRAGVSNPSEGRREPTGILRAVTRGPLYSRYLKRFLPQSIRHQIRDAVVPPMGIGTLDYDTNYLNHVLGRAQAEYRSVLTLAKTR